MEEQERIALEVEQRQLDETRARGAADETYAPEAPAADPELAPPADRQPVTKVDVDALAEDEIAFDEVLRDAELRHGAFVNTEGAVVGRRLRAGTLVYLKGSNLPVRLLADGAGAFAGMESEQAFAGLVHFDAENFRLNTPQLQFNYNPTTAAFMPNECDRCGRQIDPAAEDQVRCDICKHVDALAAQEADEKKKAALDAEMQAEQERRARETAPPPVVASGQGPAGEPATLIDAGNNVVGAPPSGFNAPDAVTQPVNPDEQLSPSGQESPSDNS